MSSVSVIIPNWNGAVQLANVLRSLEAQTHAAEEVFVIDNGSVDNSIEVARGAGATVIALDANYGFATAVNRGILAATSEWIAVINNDVDLPASWLEILLSEAQARDVWFATGKLLAPGGAIDGTYDAICRGGCAWRCGAGRPDGSPWNEPKPIRFAPLTAALFRAELFRRVGLLDDDYQSYLEDIDFGLRCATAGLSGVYVPQAVAYHEGSATLGRWHAETVRHIARNQVLLVAKHYPAGWVGNYGWPVLIAQALWGFVALRHGTGFAYVRGKLEGMRAFRKMRRAGPTAVLAILEESEREILQLQRATGFDPYWKAYFALT
jgi:GT2 family glycosyltransferase